MSVVIIFSIFSMICFVFVIVRTKRTFAVVDSGTAFPKTFYVPFSKFSGILQFFINNFDKSRLFSTSTILVILFSDCPPITAGIFAAFMALNFCPSPNL